MHYNTKSNIFVRTRNWNDDGLYYTIMIIFISTSRIGEKIHKMVRLYIKAAPWKYMQRKTHVKMDNKISIITIVSIITFTIIFITCLTSIIIHFLVLCAPIVLSENRLQSCLSPMVLCGLWLHYCRRWVFDVWYHISDCLNDGHCSRTVSRLSVVTAVITNNR